MEDGAGIAEEFRCKRSDGKQWRCSARSMPDKTVCEKHYVQAKRRAANSAMRASEKKARRKMISSPGEESFPEEEYTGVKEYSEGPSRVKRYKGRIRRLGEDAERDLMQGSPLKMRNSGKSLEDYSARSTDSSVEEEGLTCHQCQRNDRARVTWCLSCEKRGYCDICALRRYPNIAIEEIREVCPACRGICNCRKCLHGENLIKARIQEISSMEKLRHLHRVLSFLFPVLKRIHSEQCYELDLEIRVNGIESDIPRAKLQPDEQMCCDSCRMPILDYHRHCPNCEFDLCLMCCQDLRRASHVDEYADAGMMAETSEMEDSNHYLETQTDDNALEILQHFPKWTANSDGSIPCPRAESVVSCQLPLVLRRIFKINWLARLVKHTEEMVSGCKISKLSPGSRPSNSNNLIECSQREGSFDNFLYCPSLRDIEKENIWFFHRYWEMGEPVIIKNLFEPSLSACWDPLSIWKGIQEITDERIQDDIVVRAINCLNHSEIDIELRKFIKRYTNGCIDEHGSRKVLKLKDWPSENDVEEFLLCQRPEFLHKLPLLEYFHPKCGFLNLSAKLPLDSAPRDAGPKFLISCGMSEEHENIYILNLRISMGDAVYLLMHTSEVKSEGQDLNKVETVPNNYDEMESSRTSNQAFRLSLNEEDDENGIFQRGKRELDGGHDLKAGAIWDVFRRQDVPKLNKYLRDHWDAVKSPIISSNDVVPLPLYEQGIVLDEHHKKRLKEKFAVEPWTFEQGVGEAVFIPAGCPFQVRNCQSTVHLCVDFLSPESLLESARISHEIRSLPNYHEAKLQILEVGKMCLYAASSSIRYIQKIVLDPKLFSEIVFKDRNLTALVSENLERLTKRRQMSYV